MVAFSKPPNLSFTGAHTQHSDIAWICNNTEKNANSSEPRGKQNGDGLSDIRARKLECWTIMSTARFGSQYKAPQEHLPPKVANQVTEKYVFCFE